MKPRGLIPLGLAISLLLLLPVLAIIAGFNLVPLMAITAGSRTIWLVVLAGLVVAAIVYAIRLGERV